MNSHTATRPILNHSILITSGEPWDFYYEKLGEYLAQYDGNTLVLLKSV